MTINTILHNNWRFGAGWAIAFLGFPIGGLAGLGVVGGVTGIPQAMIGGAATGVVVGLAQWLVLRRSLPITPWWIVVTATGMAISLTIGVGLFGIDTGGTTLLLRGLLTGAGIGLAQFLVLRSIVAHAFVWPIVVTLGWAIGWVVTRAAGVDLTPNFTVFGATGALTFQLLTGITLAWLMRRRHTTIANLAAAPE